MPALYVCAAEYVAVGIVSTSTFSSRICSEVKARFDHDKRRDDSLAQNPHSVSPDGRRSRSARPLARVRIFAWSARNQAAGRLRQHPADPDRDPELRSGSQVDGETAAGVTQVITTTSSAVGCSRRFDQAAYIEKITNIDVPPHSELALINAQALVTGASPVSRTGG